MRFARRHSERSAHADRRRVRPGVESLEGRAVLSTLGGGEMGLWGVAGGSLWHHQDGGGWTNPGGVGIRQISVGVNAQGRNDVFAQVSDSTMWEYVDGSGWQNMHGSLNSFQAGAEGLWGVAGGSLWHFQDGHGWTNPGGLGIRSISIGLNSSGQDEVFAQVSDNTMWAYSDRSGWQNMHGALNSFQAGAEGLWGVAGGSLWHYQDGQGWTNPGGLGIGSITIGLTPTGRDDVFAQVSDNTMWEYTDSSGWQNMHGALNSFQAGAEGLWGIASGSLWHFQDGHGWTNPGGSGISSITVGAGAKGSDDVFAQVSDNTVWEYSDSPGWQNMHGSLTATGSSAPSAAVLAVMDNFAGGVVAYNTSFGGGGGGGTNLVDPPSLRDYLDGGSVYQFDTGWQNSPSGNRHLNTAVSIRKSQLSDGTHYAASVNVIGRNDSLYTSFSGVGTIHFYRASGIDASSSEEFYSMPFQVNVGGGGFNVFGTIPTTTSNTQYFDIPNSLLDEATSIKVDERFL